VTVRLPLKLDPGLRRDDSVQIAAEASTGTTP
jgi:hypothetical protein